MRLNRIIAAIVLVCLPRFATAAPIEVGSLLSDGGARFGPAGFDADLIPAAVGRSFASGEIAYGIATISAGPQLSLIIDRDASGAPIQSTYLYPDADFSLEVS